MKAKVKVIDPKTAERALEATGSNVFPVLNAIPVHVLDWEAFTQVQRDALIQQFTGKYPDLFDEIDERGWNGGLYIEANKVELVDEATDGEEA